ncbi:hypothetical protein PRIPAC_93224 [Pristionchus pacificus]|uniref:Ribosome biogenesis protein BRX1 homolog n=1 Tax=Pristionchus pacificus TaxID=54126 RepID=A0A2A6BIY5_PRIPA|nr:hypothetical protein PRIPAC_93224 [Pristionchus pacificus]|eukprot:PDM65862.1 hypothetical protein PRIPAC_44141 [Pristionchus pacificus]
MGKYQKLKRAQILAQKDEERMSDVEALSEESSSDSEDEVDKKEERKESKWINRERVLVFCSRGADFRARHLMNDMKAMMPHAKGESKMDKSAPMNQIAEIALMKNCTKTIYFETRKHKDLYMWMGNISDGPTVKFLVNDVHTMKELKMTGNVLKGSRPVLSFDATFDKEPHYALIKQVLTQTFSTPNHHPRSQPFIDHVFTFSITPNHRIYFRNFQIVDETLQLQEVGPRFVLHVDKIFSGAFEGEVLYENPLYVSPTASRRIMKQKKADAFAQKKQQQEDYKKKKIKIEELKDEVIEDPVGEMYDTNLEIEDREALGIMKVLDGRVTKRISKKNTKLAKKNKKAKAAKANRVAN